MKLEQAEMLKKLQENNAKTLTLLNEKLKREQESALDALKEELNKKNLSKMEEQKKISDQVSKDLEVPCIEVKSHKSEAKKLRIELDFLKAEQADLVVRLPF
ncbi:hypothetical protein ACH5RR_001183 [Cinchona calisaya]|uniref:Uncharacterized protein n=1 Tax=Cinchona calisaya TaxID=153742 RepID=A0ABD3B2P0_9GENT